MHNSSDRRKTEQEAKNRNYKPKSDGTGWIDSNGNTAGWSPSGKVWKTSKGGNYDTSSGAKKSGNW